MLKSLKDIAANRMPSVADLLKQTASAPRAASPSRPVRIPGSSRRLTNPAAANRARIRKERAEREQGAPLPEQSASGAARLIPMRRQSRRPRASPTASPASASRRNRRPPIRMPHRSRRAPGSCGFRRPRSAAAPSKKKGDDAAPPPPESPAQEKMENAITEQKDLLAEFAKVSDQLNDILASLEASTFVKRFKAASQQQMTIASNINQKTLDAFGIERQPVAAAVPIAKQRQGPKRNRARDPERPGRLFPAEAGHALQKHPRRDEEDRDRSRARAATATRCPSISAASRSWDPNSGPIPWIAGRRNSWRRAIANAPRPAAATACRRKSS